MKDLVIKGKLVRWAGIIDANYEELEYLKDKDIEDDSLNQCVSTLVDMFVDIVKRDLKIDEAELMVKEWLGRRVSPVSLPMLEYMEDDSAETFVNILFDYHYFNSNNSEWIH